MNVSISTDCIMALIESSGTPLVTSSDVLDPGSSFDPLAHEESLTFITGGATKAGGAIVRYTTEQPLEGAESIPILIGKGFGGSEAAYAKFRHELSLLSNQVTTYKTPRTFGDQNPERMQSKSTWTIAKELGKAAGTFEVDLVTHSMSGWIGAKLAERKPHGIRHLVIMGGAGLTDHNMINLAPGAARLAANIIRDVPTIRALEYTKADAVESLRHMFINPIRSIGEMATVSGCDVRHTLPKLSSLGVEVTLVQFENDELFPTKKIEHYADQAGIRLVIAPNLGHGAPFTHPYEVAKVVDRVLKA